MAAVNGTNLTITNSVTGSGYSVNIVTFYGVDQTTPTTDSTSAYLSSATTATITLNANDGGYAIYAATQSVDTIPTMSGGYTTVAPVAVGSAFSFSGIRSTTANINDTVTYSANVYDGWSAVTLNPVPVVTDTTPPTVGTVTITPDIGSSYTSAAPTITTQFTDADSAVSSCEYTTNGGTNWIAGVVSGAGPYTCTANPTGLSGFLNINMRAASAGGTTTATQIQRTVDTSVPTDGTLTVTAGNAQNSISWTAATDPGGSGIASYILRFNTGATATAPANCTTGTAVPGSPFTAATLSTVHTGLTNGNQYAYRLCATDNLTNTSGGVTKTVTPASGPVTTIGSCSGCHGYSAASGFADGTARNTPAGQFQGSHSVHPNACSTCHTAPTTITSADFNHANATVNMAPSINGGSYIKGSAAVSNTFAPSTCNNTTCHGGTSPTWGSATTQATCTKCHGVSGTLPAAYTADTKTAAPGYNGTGRDTGGATVATDAQVGAHDTHLRGLNSISNPIACTECHSSVNATSPSFAGHMDGSGTVSFGALATTGGAVASYSAGNCSTTYCHYGKPGSGYTAGSPVAWTNTALLTGTPSLTGDCGKCHASPPSTTGNHSGVTNINQCNGCHEHLSTAGVFTDPSKHVNGVVDASSCSSCHGWPPTTNAHTVHIDNIIAEKALGGLPGGFVDNQVCGTCHNVSSITKHAGSAGSDGTSRNITLQAADQFGVNPVSFDGATTTCSNISCHFGTSTAWGDPPTAACQVCHGYPPVTTASDADNKHVAGATAVNHIGTGATVNTKETFVSAHGGCLICHGTQSSAADGTGTQTPHANYTVAAQHNTGNINMNGPVGIGTGYDSSIRGCTAACHASTAPYRMTTSTKTLTFGDYGTGGDCISCHTIAQTSPVAQSLSASVTSRVAIVPSFSLASKHTRSRGTAVTKEDCCVCHMEGDASTGSPNGTYHKNGYIELRDPDTGATIKGVTHNGSTSTAGAYTSTGTDARPVRFSRNLGNATIEADTAAIMINMCLKCHDTDGALSATAIVPGGSALKPFAGTVSANPSGGVLDVASQFASTNKSFHPVLVRQNSGYTNTGGSRMVAPWNGVTKTATTTTYGPLISCWDCHAPNGSTSATILTSSGIHGGAVSSTDSVPLRGNVYVNGTTASTNLCVACHVVSGGTSNHGTGSAITSSTNSSMTYFQNRCYFCHGSYGSRASVARPMGAGDAHGFNTRATGAAFPAVNNGYAFLRNEGWYANGYTQSIRSIGSTTYTPTCGGMGSGGGCSRSSMGGYTPGGVY
ncbi:MAG: CxxxxCH/CxxCH domain-containing protein [Desulfuromonadaceae bacterium]|nr:CxxxxCH/CxxCH domain-containing protein [Desulfuromonadaceae bacterium]